MAVTAGLPISNFSVRQAYYRRARFKWKILMDKKKKNKHSRPNTWNEGISDIDLISSINYL